MAGDFGAYALVSRALVRMGIGAVVALVMIAGLLGFGVYTYGSKRLLAASY